MKLRKVGKTLDEQPIYRHPNGWLIVRDYRDWTWVRGAAGWSPKISWLIIPGRYPKGFRYELDRAKETFASLREAGAWCDVNVASTSDEGST